MKDLRFKFLKTLQDFQLPKSDREKDDQQTNPYQHICGDCMEERGAQENEEESEDTEEDGVHKI